MTQTKHFRADNRLVEGGRANTTQKCSVATPPSNLELARRLAVHVTPWVKKVVFSSPATSTARFRLDPAFGVRTASSIHTVGNGGARAGAGVRRH